MKNFLQLHILTAYGPANLNRDDLGQPKTATFGGTQRLRVSSQSLKRAWRQAFKQQLDGAIGIRSKRVAIDFFFKPLVDQGIAPKTALEWASSVAGQFGTVKKADKKADKKPAKGDVRDVQGPELETLVFIGQEEKAAMVSLAATCASQNRAPTEAEIELLRAKPAAVDIALFGRMLAATPEFNVEAAAQVAHAITVHPAEAESDYFTAVDDLSRSDEQGSAHIGEGGFGAGVFYLYLCISRQLLMDNLSQDANLAKRGIRALVESACTVAPGGKQNSFASRSRAFYACAELGDGQPRQLSFAFLKDLGTPRQGMGNAAIEAMEQTLAGLDAVYGAPEARCVFNALAASDGEKAPTFGSLEALLAHSVQGM
jgi:CRISPR system Cascade subunit CasC